MTVKCTLKTLVPKSVTLHNSASKNSRQGLHHRARLRDKEKVWVCSIGLSDFIDLPCTMMGVAVYWDPREFSLAPIVSEFPCKMSHVHGIWEDQVGEVGTIAPLRRKPRTSHCSFGSVLFIIVIVPDYRQGTLGSTHHRKNIQVKYLCSLLIYDLSQVETKFSGRNKVDILQKVIWKKGTSGLF